MNNQKIKLLIIIVCVLAAGICYSCSRKQENGVEEDRQILLEESQSEVNKDQSSPAPESPQETEPVYCYVHICGEVVSPGVYEVEEGSRIFQVVEQAGGFTEQAAKEYLNMAETVRDGMKVLVPNLENMDSSQVYGGAEGTSGSEPEKVNINTADQEKLMTLRGIGEARAADIIRYREEQGGFRAIEDIMNISGIKDAAFQKIKDDITV